MEPILRRPVAGRHEGSVADNEDTGEPAAGQVGRPADIGGGKLHRQRTFLDAAGPAGTAELQPVI